MASVPSLEEEHQLLQDKYTWLMESYRKAQETNSFLEERVLNAVDSAERDNEILRKSLAEAHERLEKADERIHALEKECDYLRSEYACISRHAHVFLDVNAASQQSQNSTKSPYDDASCGSSNSNVISAPHNGTFLALPTMPSPFSCTTAVYTQLLRAATANSAATRSNNGVNRRDNFYRRSYASSQLAAGDDGSSRSLANDSAAAMMTRTRSAVELNSPPPPTSENVDYNRFAFSNTSVQRSNDVTRRSPTNTVQTSTNEAVGGHNRKNSTGRIPARPVVQIV